MNLSVISMVMKLGIQDGNVVCGNAVNVVKLSIRNILKNKVMKANAPEKIYLEAIYLDNGVLPNGLNYTPSPTDIEYVRKDAFIEKACDFFEENIEEEDCKIGSSEWTELRAEYKSLDSFIRAFVKYMKGEEV